VDPKNPPASPPLRDFIHLGRFHIVAIAAFGCLTFGRFLTGRALPLVALVCALDWFLVNFVNRAVDLAEDRENGIPGTDLMAAHRRVFVPAAFVLLVGSLAALAPWAPWLVPFRVGYHLLGVAYNYPLVRGRARIKALYFWKNTASALGFLITLFAYPVAVARALVVPWWTVAALALFFFLFEVSYEVVYDLRDVDGDRREGIRTYPVVHGPRVAVRIVYALLALSSAVLVVGYALGALRWGHFVMILAPALQAAYVARALPRGITSADCVRLTLVGAALLGLYNAWIVVGLPWVDV
jgi:4-hydroxybenzoate polyprenyltransferase